MKFLFFILLSALAFPCDYSVNVPSINAVWTGSDIEVQFQINLTRNAGPNTCRTYFYTFSTGGAGNYNRKMSHIAFPSDKVDYNLYRRSAQRDLLRDFNDISSANDYIRGAAAQVGTVYSSDFYFYIQVPTTGAILRGGTYTDTVIVSVYNGANINSNPTLEQTVSLNISLTIPKEINVSLIDSGAAFDPTDKQQTLDFGTLTQGEQLGFDVRVRSNAGHDVFFESLHSGVMKTTPTTASSVPYNLLVNGSSVSLQPGAALVGSGSGVSPSQGDLYEVNVEIGDPSSSSAGVYTDVITITTQTNE